MWVIAIEYDYGVISRAGFFTEEKYAKAWAQRNTSPYTTYYAVELVAATNLSEDTKPLEEPFCEEDHTFKRPITKRCNDCVSCEWWEKYK